MFWQSAKISATHRMDMLGFFGNGRIVSDSFRISVWEEHVKVGLVGGPGEEANNEEFVIIKRIFENLKQLFLRNIAK